MQLGRQQDAGLLTGVCTGTLGGQWLGPIGGRWFVPIGGGWLGPTAGRGALMAGHGHDLTTIERFHA